MRKDEFGNEESNTLDWTGPGELDEPEPEGSDNCGEVWEINPMVRAGKKVSHAKKAGVKKPARAGWG